MLPIVPKPGSSCGCADDQNAPALALVQELPSILDKLIVSNPPTAVHNPTFQGNFTRSNFTKEDHNPALDADNAFSKQSAGDTQKMPIPPSQPIVVRPMVTVDSDGPRRVPFIMRQLLLADADEVRK